MNGVALDLDGDLESAVGGMEVRGAVLAVEHADHDAEKSRNLRHASSIACKCMLLCEPRGERIEPPRAPGECSGCVDNGAE